MYKPKSKARPWDKPKTVAAPITLRPRDEFYHTSRWTKESRAFRQEHPLCKHCEEKGLTTPSEVTDHIIPKDVCADPWDKSNWEALCKKCHQAKSSKDRKHFKK